MAKDGLALSCDNLHRGKTETRQDPFSRHKDTRFIVPDWGIKSALTWGCHTGPPGYIGWRAAVRQPHAGVTYISLVRDYEFGYGIKYYFAGS